MLDVGCGSGVLSIAAAKLGFAPVLAFDFDPQAVEASERNAADNGVSIEVRQADLREDELPETDLALANIAAEAVLALSSRVAGAARDHVRLPRLGRPGARRLPASSGASRTAAGLRTCTSAVSLSRSWRASPSASSAARSRRPTRRRCASGSSATGIARSRGRGDVAVVNTCCVTNEGLAKSRQAASRAARTHARVYVTGCGARLSETAFAGLPANVTVVAGPDRAGRRDRRRRRRRDRLRAGGRAARPRARVRQDPGRLLVLVRVLRDPARARRDAEPQRRGGARRDPPARRPGSPRDRPHRRQPRLLPRPRRRPHARRR